MSRSTEEALKYAHSSFGTAALLSVGWSGVKDQDEQARRR